MEELVLEREDRDLKLEVVIGKLEVVLLVDLVLQASIVEEQVLVLYMADAFPICFFINKCLTIRLGTLQ